MTGFNLPPGCNECDLPGNRPEDVAFDHWLEEFEDERMEAIGELLESDNWDDEESQRIRDMIDGGASSGEIIDEFGGGEAGYSLDHEFERWYSNREPPERDYDDDERWGL